MELHHKSLTMSVRLGLWQKTTSLKNGRCRRKETGNRALTPATGTNPSLSFAQALASPHAKANLTHLTRANPYLQRVERDAVAEPAQLDGASPLSRWRHAW